MAQHRFALDHAETRARKLPSPWAMFLGGFLKLPTDHLTHLAALNAKVAAVPAIAAALAREQEIG